MEDIDVDVFFEESEPSKKDNKIIFIILGIMLVILVLFLISLFLTLGYKNIYEGISVNGINIGGMSVEEAKNRLDSNYNDLSDINVLVKCDKYENDFYGKDINATFNAEVAANMAYSHGREGNIFNKIFLGLKSRLTDVNLEYNVTVDRKKIDNEISKVTKDVIVQGSDWSYTRVRDALIVRNGETGIKADTEKAIKDIIGKLNNMQSGLVEVEIEKVHPEKVDIDRIQKEISSKAQNAEYISDTGKIIEQIIGIEIKDIDQAKKVAESVQDEGMQFSIPLLITIPEVTTENVLNELFKDKLSTYKSYYNVNEKERTENVKLASEFINGVILMPGQEFSYNNIVGERSVERGFKSAKVYQRGEVVEGLGGGICQVSSTLYNSVVMADLEVLERKNHSLPVSYVKVGRDATVVYGNIDFRFKNSRQYPIKIVSNASGGLLTIDILGYNTTKNRSVDIETEVIEVLPFKEREIVDETLEPGTSKITTKGSKGYKVKSYRVTKENGEVVERKLISLDTYAPIAQVKKIGVIEENNDVDMEVL